MQPVIVQADGLLLRPWRPGDRDQIEAVGRDPEIGIWNPMTAAADEWVARRADWSDGRHASWAVVVPEHEAEVLASVSLHQIDVDNSACEVGYWVRADRRGRGIATRALSAATDFAFDMRGLSRVFLFHAVDNPGSCRVAEGAGFAHEGVHRRSHRYGDGQLHDEHSHARLAADGPGRLIP